MKPKHLKVNYKVGDALAFYEVFNEKSYMRDQDWKLLDLVLLKSWYRFVSFYISV